MSTHPKNAIKAHAKEEVGAAGTYSSTSSHDPEMRSACGVTIGQRTNIAGGGCEQEMASM